MNKTQEEHLCRDIRRMAQGIERIAKALDTKTGEVRELFKQSNEELRKAVERIKQLPSAEPEAISKWKKEFREYVDSLDIARDDWKGIIEYIDELPSVQPDIIRCKDCKHWNPQLKTANGNGLGSCDFHNVALVTSEGFCYWAERGEQNDSEAD